MSPLTFTNVIRNNPHNLSPTLPACLIENLSWSAVYELSNLDSWQTGNKATFPRPIISLYHLFSSRKCCLIEPKIADISRTFHELKFLMYRWHTISHVFVSIMVTLTFISFNFWYFWFLVVQQKFQSFAGKLFTLTVLYTKLPHFYFFHGSQKDYKELSQSYACFPFFIDHNSLVVNCHL